MKISKEELLKFLLKDIPEDDKTEKVQIEYLNDAINILFEERKKLNKGFKFLDEDIKAFFEGIENLNKTSKINLKKSLGIKTMNPINFLYPIYFKNSSFRNSSEDNRRLWCLCAQIYCYMGGQLVGNSFSSCLKDVLKSDSASVRFERFLACSTDKFEYFSRDLISYVRIIQSKGFQFDCIQLLKDLLDWNNEYQWVQLRWADVFNKEDSENNN